ncbi:MAG: hypothetical protein LBE91_19310 [Tannerella sp.]|jgi:hypothetical protein|nr:hypothetical protein [Tannerella sp.]
MMLILTIWKIAEIRDDSIFFIDNKYVTDRELDTKKLHRLGYYDLDSVIGFSRNDLKVFYDDDIICKIWRNLPYQMNAKDLTEEELQLLESADDDVEEEEGFHSFSVPVD